MPGTLDRQRKLTGHAKLLQWWLNLRRLLYLLSVMNRFLLVLGVLVSTAATSQEVVLRHALSGGQLETLENVVLQFNEAQKGKGKVILQAASGEDDVHTKVHMGLLDAGDSMKFFGTLPRFIPLQQMMKEHAQQLSAKEFFPQIADTVDDSNGQLQALPLGLNFPVLFLNRTLLAKAGKTDPVEPRSWVDLQELAGDLRTSGSACPLTSSNFSWIHVENLAAQHGQAILPVQANKRSPEVIRVNGLVNVKHLALLATWQRSKYFIYSGPGREADARFLSGECAMLTGESSLFAEIVRHGIDASVAPLPYYDDMSEARPSDLLPDGSSLWILAGHKKPEYQLIARFVRYLMLPETQRTWVKGTTFLPMSSAAVKALQEATNIPNSQKEGLVKRLSMPRKAGEHLRNGSTRDLLRAIFNEEVLSVWNEKYPAKQALDVTSARANTVPAANAKPAGAVPGK